MAGNAFYIEDNIDSLVAFFDDLILEVDDMHVPLGRTMEYIRDTVIEQFTTEGERSGGWEPLSDAYEKWKLARVGAEPMLQLYGDLLLAAVHPGAVDTFADHATYEINDPKAVWHQFGALRSKGGRLPERELIVELPEDRGNIEEIWWEWFDYVASHAKVRSYEAHRGERVVRVPGYYRSKG